MPVWASMLDLPQEILDIITPLISHSDYPACILVNHCWSTLFTPLLWEVVQVGDRTMQECFGTREARNALARNCQYIRVLETTDPAIIYYLANFYPTTVTKLDSLTIRLKDHPTSSILFSTAMTVTATATATAAAVPATTNDNSKGTLDIPRCASTVIQILQKNRDLRYLSLDLGCFRYEDGREAMADLVSVFPTAKLEKLELSFLNSVAYDRELGNEGDADTEKLIEYYLAKHEPFHALKEVVIIGGSQNDMDIHRLTFLFRCHNVETVRLHRLDSNAMKALRVFLRAGCPKLVNLEWRKGTHDPEEFIVGLLKASREGWRELRLPDMPEFGTDSWEALMEHVETLEALRIESAERLPPNGMVDLLCSAKRLRRLEGIADRQRKWYTVEPNVNACESFLEHYVDQMGDRSWVLGPSMEHLQLQIQCVPRPDVLYRQSGGELMFHQTGLDPALRVPVQHWIYNQLGRMTGLQELIVGLMDLSEKTMASRGIDRSMDSIALEEALLGKEPHVFNYLSLEFSLESGLSLLSGLKEMRMLDVRSTAHYIGVAELEWMHVNWPMLETIRGLGTDWRWSINYAEGPARKAAVEAWMAAHPLGIGSSFYPKPSN
ncbi:hypothetical protein EC957_006948 [Mortierella hygrophila]|uniref:F-box domain-containing protein n=1 Tax=Mortierella hygrophila TaxID=979708 RepID=A0A9P6EYZ6_9FUNG|nr:hypothetical protein EC957_006948 [Mortierella hygrophila]